MHFFTTTYIYIYADSIIRLSLLSLLEQFLLWCAGTLAFFFFFYLFFLILYFLSFDFLFLFLFMDNEEACDCSHMTYHMMWGS